MEKTNSEPNSEQKVVLNYNFGLTTDAALLQKM
jgi:hypothetical protein